MQNRHEKQLSDHPTTRPIPSRHEMARTILHRSRSSVWATLGALYFQHTRNKLGTGEYNSHNNLVKIQIEI